MPDDARLDRKRVWLAEVALVFVTLLWGISFPWMKGWQDAARDCPGRATAAETSSLN